MASAAERRLMMQTQWCTGQARVSAMAWGSPVRIERLGGEFAVMSGRVWVTRRGDAHDHVLAAGQRFAFGPADSVVVEALDQDAAVVLHWQPAVQRSRLAAWPAEAAARALRGVAAAARVVALGLRRVEAGLDALARKATSLAGRAQDRIGAGEAIASAGTVR
jgi:hypothetical protein